MASDRERTPLTPDEVLAFLPQQRPFRFLDEILHIDEDSAIGAYTFRHDETFYAGHFPGNPVTPGVILLETMGQIGVVALGIYLKSLSVDEQTLRKYVAFFTDGECEFFSVVSPGQRVICHAKKIFYRMNKLRAAVEMVRESGEVIARATVAGMGVIQ